MFDLKRPCVNCPFKKGQGHLFQLNADRLEGIIKGSAFQCHKTLQYDDEGDTAHGDKPQQCAGLMSVLHKEGRPNQIMQVAERLGFLDPEQLNKEESYDSWADVLKAHSGQEP